MPRSGSSRGRSSGYGRSGGTSRNYSRNNTGYGSTSSFKSRAAPSSPRYNTIQRPSQGMGLGGMLASGLAFGSGSALAHSALSGVFGRSSAHGYPAEQANPNNQSSQNNLDDEIKSNPCYEFNWKFIDCLKVNESDISKCQTLFGDMMSCQKNLV